MRIVSGRGTHLEAFATRPAGLDDTGTAEWLVRTDAPAGVATRVYAEIGTAPAQAFPMFEEAVYTNLSIPRALQRPSGFTLSTGLYAEFITYITLTNSNITLLSQGSSWSVLYVRNSQELQARASSGTTLVAPFAPGVPGHFRFVVVSGSEARLGALLKWPVGAAGRAELRAKRIAKQLQLGHNRRHWFYGQHG